MTATIDSNLQDGNAISKHLYGQGVDFRSNDMTTAQKAALRSAIRKNGGIPLQEGIPPHIHASF